MASPIKDIADKAADAAALLKQLANEKRLMICCCLAEQELSVSELNEFVPLSQSALSQHLMKLREADIVVTRKEGQTVFYRLDSESVIAVILTLKSIYCPEIN